ncbi:DUF1553 domain-containing protein [Telmatocola sphagniphila]|uniref:DUF1553 domain-containing protein n=1 Tax=Telmatocola sphagniphila TaxID=1123043 RepID=A0A8E6EXS0_9BACT|nr:DUF1553 domain-containing protein [Telmatocola sphagniphila]QVL31586.1 DUF1553 domain-containing protein [Telmatocola sphagniphila]
MLRFQSALLGLFASAIAVHAESPTKLEYNRDIRPILAENCFPCHGPDSASRKAGLRIDQREGALAKKAIIPGKSVESELIVRILSKDDTEKMPPPETNKNITPAQLATLKQWIDQGAEYQAHWSFIPPKKPAIPTVANQKWVTNPIDNFILAELEKRKITPAPEAERRALIRRLSLDTTGLPPDPKDVEAAVNDKSPNWYEKVVDKFMASPNWGEHRARYWLDAARYGDTHGIHFDNYREMWAYRDWVINAFNQNMKFDEFTIEQLAGDLLNNPTLDQKVATGFNRCNITTNEGGAINEEYLVLYNRDRTETVSQVWMGLTAGCAVCHDHKFDPLTMRDFYSMAAFFNNTTQAAMDGNIKDTPPIINVPMPEDRAKWETVTKQMNVVRAQIAERKKTAHKDFDEWVKTATPATVANWEPKNGLKFEMPLNESQGKKLAYKKDGKEEFITAETGFAWGDKGRFSEKAFQVKAGGTLNIHESVGDFDTKQPFTVSVWVKPHARGVTGAVIAKMDLPPAHRGWDLWMENDRVGTHFISNWPDNAVKVVSKTPLKLNQWQQVVITFDGSAKGEGVRIFVDGNAQAVDILSNNLKPDSTTRTKVPFQIGARGDNNRNDKIAIGDVRLYDRRLDVAEVERLSKSLRCADLLKKEKRTPQENNELFEAWLAAQDKPYQKLISDSTALQEEEVRIKSRGTITHIMNERDGEPIAYILNRGEYDQRKDKVKADVPKSLPPMDKSLPRNRLGFAEWLLKPEHPLTTRVTVNRYWQEVFGNGLVRSSGDFGITGELPTHPELLDWLAIEFREQGWDIKKFFKMIFMSSTYRQSAVTPKEKLDADPSNKWLSRGPRFRMDAEMIRDYALATSSLLTKKIGGPSVKPYQPDGVWEAVAMIGSNTRDYRRDTGANLYRRSMYTLWKRAAPPAAMEILNAPNRETCAVRRERTNTPIQALLTMNDIQFVEADRNLAEKLLKSPAKTDEERIQLLGEIVLSRPFKPAEMAILTAGLKDLHTEYNSKPDQAKKLIAVGESKADPKVDAKQLAAWTMLVNEVLNLDEALNK